MKKSLIALMLVSTSADAGQDIIGDMLRIYAPPPPQVIYVVPVQQYAPPAPILPSTYTPPPTNWGNAVTVPTAPAVNLNPYK